MRHKCDLWFKLQQKHLLCQQASHEAANLLIATLIVLLYIVLLAFPEYSGNRKNISSLCSPQSITTNCQLISLMFYCWKVEKSKPYYLAWGANLPFQKGMQSLALKVIYHASPCACLWKAMISTLSTVWAGRNSPSLERLLNLLVVYQTHSL